MKPGLSFLSISSIAAALILLSCQAGTQHSTQSTPQEQPLPSAYLGFDLNIFPGRDALPALRKTFSFSSYWLSPPTGERTNTWLGQREVLRAQGFGFLLLYLGPLSRELKNEMAAVQKGTLDARNAASTAKSEGFPPQAIIFLDVEEGGRLPAAYHSYLGAWTAELQRSGFRSGAYCSGIPIKEEPGATITTADDICAHAPSQDFAYFIFNDVCPPSPGCTFPQNPAPPAAGGIPYAEVWQFAQSPRRMERTAHCAPGYHTDGNCYAPGDTTHAWLLDVDTATSPDPSSASGASK
ncbi:MAG: glycoside hydrolase domain-containing protein [Candidatus Acidiferrales bacterium]